MHFLYWRDLLHMRKIKKEYILVLIFLFLKGLMSFILSDLTHVLKICQALLIYMKIQDPNLEQFTEIIGKLVPLPEGPKLW